MATWTVTGGGSTGHSASAPTVKVYSEIVDFSEFTTAATDVIQVIELPANSLVLYAGMDCLTADSSGNSNTLELGDADDPNRYVAASAPAAGIETTLARSGSSTSSAIGWNFYAAADTIDIKSAAGVTTTAKMRVFAVVADCDGHGDNESQNVTFA